MSAAGRIYVLAHAQARTGGPEAQHQLCRTLLDLGHDAAMVYLPRDMRWERRGDAIEVPPSADPTPADYAHYGLPLAWRIEDAPQHRVVFPEVWIDLALGMGRAFQPCLWWLSVDNARRHVRRAGGFAALRAHPRLLHLAQSHYALDHLGRHGITALPLFDFTAPAHLEGLPAADDAPRAERVLFPRRGLRFTRWLRLAAPDIAWQEIRGFSEAEVRALFRGSRLYVDFGHHPGKDRMPREAAIGGCVVLAARRGAAANPVDVPIPAGFKFAASPLAIPAILRRIRAILADPAPAQAAMAPYRRVIATEREEFALQARRVFGDPAARPVAPAAATAARDAVPA
jgi:hypothetical protein